MLLVPLLFRSFLFTGLLYWLCVSPFCAQAVFRIDSLPANGVALDKAWKWHLGDNSNWAIPDTLNLTQDGATLTNIPIQGIGWLRLNPPVSSQLQGKIMYINLVQAGASDVILDWPGGRGTSTKSKHPAYKQVME